MASRMHAVTSKDTDGDQSEQQACCWACRALVVVPTMQDGMLARIFKVGAAHVGGDD
jgi:hypothetical protein